MIDYFNIAGGFIQSYPIPDDLEGWRIATPEDYESLRVSDWPAAIAARRYEAEVSGIVWRGVFIATDRESRALIDQEIAAVGRGLRDDGNGWKCLDPATGKVYFRPTSNAEMEELGATVYAHVRDCFRREDALLALGDSITAADLETDWP